MRATGDGDAYGGDSSEYGNRGWGRCDGTDNSLNDTARNRYYGDGWSGEHTLTDGDADGSGVVDESGGCNLDGAEGDGG